MSWISVIWEWGVAGGNVEHIGAHGLTPDDVDHVLENPKGYDVSRSTGDPAVFGYTFDDRLIFVTCIEIDTDTIFPTTAYEVSENS